MLTLPPSVRIYVATAPCDMRKQFDGIAFVSSSSFVAKFPSVTTTRGNINPYTGAVGTRGARY